MSYPVCPTCGFLLADKELKYEEELKKLLESKDKNTNDNLGKILDKLQITRYCCRMRMMTYIDLSKHII